MATNKSAVIKPMEFRFTEPADVEKYGEGWFAYDELAIVTTPARDLMRLEAEIGAPIAAVMNGFRESSVFGDTCAAWLALKAAGRDVAFKDFNPTTMLLEWRAKAPAPKEGGASSPATPAASTASSPRPSAETGAPETTPFGTGQLGTVALPSLPASESGS